MASPAWSGGSRNPLSFEASAPTHTQPVLAEHGHARSQSSFIRGVGADSLSSAMMTMHEEEVAILFHSR
jgi:hypothetical protein